MFRIDLFKTNSIKAIFLILLTALFVSAETEAVSKPNTAKIVRQAAAEGKLAYKLTTRDGNSGYYFF
jgi:hypothetical protein